MMSRAYHALNSANYVGSVNAAEHRCSEF